MNNLINITANQRIRFKNPVTGEPIWLGHNGVIAVILKDDRELYGWIESYQGIQSAYYTAPLGRFMYIAHNVNQDNELIAAARKARAEHAAAAGVTVSEVVTKY